MIKKILKETENFNIDILYVFGSFFTDYFNKESDIDIAYYGDLTTQQYLNLTKNLTKILNRNIDLVDLKKIDQNFAAEIINKGKCVYYKNLENKQNLEMQILGNYLTLEEDRKIVIDAIYQRGSVYGKSHFK